MTEKPILFSAPMVRAILSGEKTQTRRIVKPQPPTGYDRAEPLEFRKKVGARFENDQPPLGMHTVYCPYGQPGDRLWVRETWCLAYDEENGPDDRPDERPLSPDGQRWAYYKATEPGVEHCDGDRSPWHPSIHMPRWASRITLEVTGMRVERLQDISEEDARAEGATYHDGLGKGHSGWRHDDKDVYSDARSSFARLWCEINGSESWSANPWVWVVEFKRLT